MFGRSSRSHVSTVTRDTTPPTLIIGACNPSPAGPGTVTAIVTFYDVIAGIDTDSTPSAVISLPGGNSVSVSLSLTGSTTNDQSATWTGTAAIPADTVDGSATLTVSGVADKVGNVLESTAAATFSVQGEPPEPPGISAEPVNGTGTSPILIEGTKRADVVVYWKYSDEGVWQPATNAGPWWWCEVDLLRNYSAGRRMRTRISTPSGPMATPAGPRRRGSTSAIARGPCGGCRR